jgi:hypothetical protein
MVAKHRLMRTMGRPCRLFNWRGTSQPVILLAQIALRRLSWQPTGGYTAYFQQNAEGSYSLLS